MVKNKKEKCYSLTNPKRAKYPCLCEPIICHFSTKEWVWTALASRIISVGHKDNWLAASQLQPWSGIYLRLHIHLPSAEYFRWDVPEVPHTHVKHPSQQLNPAPILCSGNLDFSTHPEVLTFPSSYLSCKLTPSFHHFLLNFPPVSLVSPFAHHPHHV